MGIGKSIAVFLGGVVTGVAGTLGVSAIVRHVKAGKKEKPKKTKYVKVPPKKEAEEKPETETAPEQE